MAQPVIATQSQPNPVTIHDSAASNRVIAEIRAALNGLKYGEINVLVQDGVVIRIERTEKARVNLNSAGRLAR